MNKAEMISMVFIGILIGFTVGVIAHTHDFRVEAIKYHHAYYAPTTGDFTWKKNCK